MNFGDQVDCLWGEGTPEFNLGLLRNNLAFAANIAREYARTVSWPWGNTDNLGNYSGLDKTNLSGLESVRIQSDEKTGLVQKGDDLVVFGGAEARVERGDREFAGRVEKKFGDSDWDRGIEDSRMKDLVEESFQGDEVLFAIPADNKVVTESLGSQEPGFALPPPEAAVV